jgi:hypothetical protein
MPNASWNFSIIQEITGSILKDKYASHSRIHECIKYSEPTGHAMEKWSKQTQRYFISARTFFSPALFFRLYQMQDLWHVECDLRMIMNGWGFGRNCRQSVIRYYPGVCLKEDGEQWLKLVAPLTSLQLILPTITQPFDKWGDSFSP